MADADQLERALRAADAAGDTEGATVLARELTRVRQPSGGLVEGAKEYAKNPVGNTVQSLGDLGAGIYRGFKNVTDAGLQAGYHAVGQGARADQIIGDQRKQYDEATKGRIAAPVGEVAGGVLATLPLALNPATSAMARIGQGAGLGALVGAAQPATGGDFLTEKAKQAGLGALAGGAGGAFAEGLARVMAPKTAPAVQKLIDEGVGLTPGQILGGKFQRVEQGFGSVPVLGDVVRGAERRSVESLNQAAYNRALSPIGESAAGIKAGREGIEAVQDKLSSAYNTLLPKLNIRADAQFTADVQSIRRSADLLPKAQQEQFDKLLQNEFSKFAKATGSPGEVMKHVDSQLATFARRFQGNPDGNNQMLAEAVSGVRDAMRSMVTRSNAGNPELVKELGAINEGYANFVRLQRAAGAQGANEGVFSGAQLSAAVRGLDSSARKGQFAKGDALMQDLSDAAKSVMSQKVPDSGTPYRTLLALLGSGAVSPSAAVAGGAAMLPYTAPGQRLAQTLLTERPDELRRLASLLSASSPAIGAGAGGLLMAP